MQAVLVKLGQWVVTYVLEFIAKKLWAFISLLLRRQKQIKKDEKNIEEYKDAVKNKSEAEIDKETTDLLNS